ncbi:MAG: hypothetical protein IH621_09430 [Krumholzibacteria bacterium]|nr:hypothetical protein [Candidatus Krumholzibacteria bacterium]
MKRFLVLTAIMALSVGIATAQPYIYENQNEIGIYTTPNPTADGAQGQASYTGTPGTFMAYVVLTNPWNQLTGTPIASVGGFEFFLGLPADVFLLSAALPPATVNFATAPDFLCGANIPVVDNHCTLITLNLGWFSGAPGFGFLKPVQNTPQSVPNEMAITDFFDDFRISVAYPVSGDHEVPVFGIGNAVVPTEDASWGEVKSMFR